MFPVATEKHSSPWGFDQFVFIFKFYVFSQSVNVSVDRGSTGHYSLTRISVRYLMACQVLLGTLTLCYVPTKSSSFKVFYGERGRWVVFEPVCAHSSKRRHIKLLQLLYMYYEPLIRKHHPCK